MSKFTQVMDDVSADKEIERLFAMHNILPLREEALREAAVPFIKQGLKLGHVEIHDDRSITQKMFVPVEGMDSLVYKGERIPAKQMRVELNRLKELTPNSKADLYIRLYTNKFQSQIEAMEMEDRNIAEAIALFLY